MPEQLDQASTDQNRFLFTGDHLDWDRNAHRLSASEDYCWYSWPEQVGSVRRLADYRFPAQILPASRLAETLRPERVDELRAAIDGMSKNDGTSRIGYACPWTAESVRRGSADLVFSQAALQEIDNPGANGALRRTFAAMAQWLKPGGIISHQVDLGMYGAEPWDRHWTYSDATWAVIRGRRPNYINRQPLSAYEGLCREFGFDIARLDVVEQDIATPTSELAVGFRTLSQRDRTARAVHIVAVKR